MANDVPVLANTWMRPGHLHSQRQRDVCALAASECPDGSSELVQAWHLHRRPIGGCRSAFQYDPDALLNARVYRTSDNLHVAMQEQRLPAQLAVRTVGDEMVTIRIMLAGQSRFRTDAYDTIEMKGPLVTVHAQRRDELLYHEIAATTQRVLTVVACPQALRSDFGWALQDTAGPVPLPLTPTVEKIARELVGNQFDGARHETFVRARTLDLLCTLATEWEAAQPCDGERLALSMRDRERLHALRELLEETAHRPAPIAQLARQVGMNKTKLMRGFKQVFGETIADFCRRLRLEEAHAMVLADRLSIGEIAAAVGYQHQSSFTTAFSTHFGVSPKALSRGAVGRRAA